MHVKLLAGKRRATMRALEHQQRLPQDHDAVVIDLKPWSRLQFWLLKQGNVAASQLVWAESNGRCARTATRALPKLLHACSEVVGTACAACCDSSCVLSV